MARLREYNYYEDKDHDACGNTTMAVIEIGDFMTIPLCSECLESLRNSLKEYDEKVFCYRCQHFKQSESGWNYGGSCCKDQEISDGDAGYINCKDNFSTCEHAIRKES